MAFNFYTPDAIKALALHFGSYEKAAKHLGVSKASLINAGNADITGKTYELSTKVQARIFAFMQRIGAKRKKDIQLWHKLLEHTGTLAVKRAFMNAKPAERQWAQQLYAQRKFQQLKAKNFWGKVMSKFYDKYKWQRGKFKR